MLHVQMLRADRGLDVSIAAAPLRLPENLESEVEALWRIEQARRSHSLFNGAIISAVKVTAHCVDCRVVEYRHLIAQRARPDLYDALQIRPVAVSGLLECASGVVFGKRARTVTQGAGLWELVPSGGLDADKVGSGSAVDYRGQIVAELREEIGIASEAISSVTPLCLVDDPESHVLDIGVSIVSPLSGAAVLEIHRECASEEYDELRVVAACDIDDLIRHESARLVDVSAALIQALGKYRST